MAEQRVDVRNVKGQSVTIAPQQNVYGAQGPAARGWTEALVRGPVERLGIADRAREAEDARDRGDHQVAAVQFEEIAEALRRSDYGPAADQYLERAGAAFAEAGEQESAYRIYTQLARGAIGDGELTATFRARRAREHVSPERSWEAEGLLARAGWPEQRPEDEAALQNAWEQTKGTAEEAEWAAGLVELLLLNGKAAQALDVAREARGRIPLEGGWRLDLELDFLDLVEQEEGGERAERDWSALIDWASDLRARQVEDTARIWQRRGVAPTARMKDLGASSRASRRARRRGGESRASRISWPRPTSRHSAPPTRWGITPPFSTTPGLWRATCEALRRLPPSTLNSSNAGASGTS